MAQLMVRNLSDDLVTALKQRAGQTQSQCRARASRDSGGCTPAPGKRRRFAEVLASIPNVGRDDDFAREQDWIMSLTVYLVDTDVISEASKGERANSRAYVLRKGRSRRHFTVYLSVITIGELRQGVEKIRCFVLTSLRPNSWNVEGKT